MSQYSGSGGQYSRSGGKGSLQGDTAGKLKQRFQWLESFSDDELAEISYCDPGESISPDEVYFDISNPERGIIQGESGHVPKDSCYVPRSKLPLHLWDKLTGNYS